VLDRAGKNVVKPDRLDGNNQFFSLFSVYYFEMNDLGRIIAAVIKKVIAAGMDVVDGKAGSVP